MRIPSARLVLLFLAATLFTAPACSLFGEEAPSTTTSGVDQNSCEALDGAWIAPDPSGFDCVCYDTTCCAAIGEESNVRCRN